MLSRYVAVTGLAALPPPTIHKLRFSSCRFKRKKEKWEEKQEAERQADRAFMIQAQAQAQAVAQVQHHTSQAAIPPAEPPAATMTDMTTTTSKMHEYS